MSKLAKDTAAFKSALHRQDYTSWHSQPPPLDVAPTGSTPPSDISQFPAKKKRPKASMTGLFLQPQSCRSCFKLDIVYSQPADTGTGTNVNTQLVYAVNHLKASNLHEIEGG